MNSKDTETLTKPPAYNPPQPVGAAACIGTCTGTSANTTATNTPHPPPPANTTASSSNANNKKMQMSMSNNLKIQNQIGSGAFSTVHLATHSILNSATQSRQKQRQRQNQPVQLALKIIPKSKIDQMNLSSKIQQEVSSLKKCRAHGHIITLYHVINTTSSSTQNQHPHSNSIILVTDYLSGGELHDYISSFIVQSKTLPKYQTIVYFSQIISALSYLHNTLHIVHRDIKLENILLDADRKNVKLADFGFSKCIRESVKMKTRCGSPYYAAPELLFCGDDDNNDCSSSYYDGDKVDVYSVGVILYVMLCGKFPFIDSEEKVMFEKIRKGRYVLPTHLDDDEKYIIRGLMNVNRCERMNVDDVFQSRYYDKNLPFYLKDNRKAKNYDDDSNDGEVKEKEQNDCDDCNERDDVIKKNNSNKKVDEDIDYEVCDQVLQLFKQSSSLLSSSSPSSSLSSNQDKNDSDDSANDYSTLTMNMIEKIISQKIIHDNHDDDPFINHDDDVDIDVEIGLDTIQDVQLLYERCLDEKRRMNKGGVGGIVKGIRQLISDCIKIVGG